MNNNTVNELPVETVKLLTSSQIITSVSTAVKELLENSIDAGAKFIQVRLENYGLDLIEVKDDGSGVSYDNVQRMFLPGYTSKIKRFEDLEKLQSYGFRGEALAALCKIGKISIATKTNLDTLAMSYEIDVTGLPLSSKPSHLNKGTIISVSGLFSNLPVRRLYLLSKKKLSEELKKTEYVVQMLALIHPDLNVSIIHNKCPVWKKNSVKGIKQSFMQVAGLKIVSKMDHVNKTFNSIELDFIIPKKNLEDSDNMFSNNSQNVYVYVNNRPIICKTLSQVVQEHIFHHFRSLNISFKYAVCLLAIKVPPDLMDINLEPNKTKVLLKNQMELIKLINDTLCNYYGNENFNCSALKNSISEEEEDKNEEHQNKRPRLGNKNVDPSIGEKRCEKFREKNKDWDLKIINADCAVNPKIDMEMFGDETFQIQKNPLTLCSQINQENCVLTTEEEVSQLNAILKENHGSLVSNSNCKNSEIRLAERNDIQCRSAQMQNFPEWPLKPQIPNNFKQTDFADLDNKVELNSTNDNDCEMKSSEEIAAEIEKDAVKWSTEIMREMEKETNESLPEKKSDIEEYDYSQFNLSVQSISSQMGKKEMKGFTKFARLMRPKITQEFPNMIFTQVAQILAERWKALNPEEQKSYSKMAEVIDENRKTYQKSKENKLSENCKTAVSNNVNIKTLLERNKTKIKKSRPPRKEIFMTLSLNQIKTLRIDLKSIASKESDYELLGQLKPNCYWLYKKGKEIGHISCRGLRELISFRKMLSNHYIPRQALASPILLNEEVLGSELWNLLISFDFEYDLNSAKYVINDDVINKNGFLVEVRKENNVTVEAKIIEVAESIPFFGISELKEVLKNFQKTKEVGGLDSWRTSSIYNYLMNESVRLAQESRQADREEIESMINTYNLCLKHLPPICPHSKDIFAPIYYIQEENLGY